MVDLAIDKLIPDLSQSWEVGILLLVHHEYHSSARRRQRSSFLLSIVQARPLQVSVADEVGINN